MITIGTIVRWEALLNKSFSDLNLADTRELTALYYAGIQDRTTTFEVYAEAIQETEPGKKELRKFAHEICAEANYIKQFTPDSGASPEKSDGESVRVTDTVGELILKGVDAEWLMNRCGVETLLMLNEQNLREEKKRAEAKRLEWYVLMQPYIDRKVCQNMQAFFPLPWDEESKRVHTITDLDLNLANSMLSGAQKWGNETKIEDNADDGDKRL